MQQAVSAFTRARTALHRRSQRFRQVNWAGHCPICEGSTRFYARGSWYRDDLRCGRCGSLPRQRALMYMLNHLYPEWRGLAIHESSPSGGGASAKMARECAGYLPSQYDPVIPFGTTSADGRYRSEDLEAQTFADACFDLVITQDVFEHLFHPDRAIAEIVRTLKPGGAHIMTVPIVRKHRASGRRATIADGVVEHLVPPEYHGNPVDEEGGALVTVDWGYDIATYLTRHSGCETWIAFLDRKDLGICAEYIEVVVTRKGGKPALV